MSQGQEQGQGLGTREQELEGETCCNAARQVSPRQATGVHILLMLNAQP